MSAFAAAAVFTASGKARLPRLRPHHFFASLSKMCGYPCSFHEATPLFMSGGGTLRPPMLTHRRPGYSRGSRPTADICGADVSRPLSAPPEAEPGRAWQFIKLCNAQWIIFEQKSLFNFWAVWLFILVCIIVFFSKVALIGYQTARKHVLIGYRTSRCLVIDTSSLLLLT